MRRYAGMKRVLLSLLLLLLLLQRNCSIARQLIQLAADVGDGRV